MEKNPSVGFEGYVKWVFVDTFFWLSFTGSTLLGGLALFSLLISYL
jgi:hypothetical protein